MGLLLEKDVFMIAATLAVLKARRIFVPLDPTYPLARIADMLEDSQASLMLTNHRNLPLARELAADRLLSVLNLDELESSVADDDLGLPISPDTPAYILYTSGSTGHPKGIYHCHRGVLHNISNCTNAFHIGFEDRLTLLHSCSFSSGFLDMFCALLNGASLFVWDTKQEGLANLARFLISERITLFSWIPTPYRHFVETLTGTEAFPDLRMVSLSSEPVYRSDVDLYRRHFSPSCVLVNRLGTTETFSFRFYFMDQESQLSGNIVPAGYPVSDKEVFLLNEEGNVVKCGEVGEIAVHSNFLSARVLAQARADAGSICRRSFRRHRPNLSHRRSWPLSPGWLP